MKRLVIILLVCGMATPALAFLGLPIADDANTQVGDMRVTGSATFESDVNLFGGRFTYGVMDDMAVFGGAGIIDVDGADSEPYFQLGTQYKLPVDAAFDLALRGAFGLTSFDDSHAGWKSEVDLWMLNVGALASMQIDHQFTIYGFGGISHQNWEYSFRSPYGRYSDSGSDTELAIAGGAIYALDQNISLFGEISHIDDLFISIGARFDF